VTADIVGVTGSGELDRRAAFRDIDDAVEQRFSFIVDSRRSWS
jgi:hypothetical protein